jgi:hypothetical protein
VAFVVGALTNVIFMKALGPMVEGKPAISVVIAGGNIDKIIPTYLDKMWPSYFGIIFMLAMFAAAMSTLSAQYHAGGTSLGRDFYEKGIGGRGDTLMAPGAVADDLASSSGRIPPGYHCHCNRSSSASVRLPLPVLSWACFGRMTCRRIWRWSAASHQHPRSSFMQGSHAPLA